MNAQERLDGFTKLREAFPPAAIGKLPRVTCRDCSQSQGRVCNQHQKKKCPECKAWITTAHIHLDYVGHAETTDRLLSVDPEWNWEPVAFDPDGSPALVVNNNGQPTGLWIKLSVLGVTRIGYGSCEPGKFDAVKELIGDAIRNAAMRFGVALDLWAKGELESNTVEESAAAKSSPDPQAQASSSQRSSDSGGVPAPADSALATDESPGEYVRQIREWVDQDPKEKSKRKNRLLARAVRLCNEASLTTPTSFDTLGNLDEAILKQLAQDIKELTAA